MYRNCNYTGVVLWRKVGCFSSHIFVQSDIDNESPWDENDYPMRMVRIWVRGNHKRHEDKPLPQPGDRIQFLSRREYSVRGGTYIYAEILKYPDPEREKWVVKAAEILADMWVLRKYKLELVACERDNHHSYVKVILTIWLPFWEQLRVGDEVQACRSHKYLRKYSAELVGKWRKASLRLWSRIPRQD